MFSLADIIRKRAAVTPALIALAEPSRLTSFAELDRRSSQVARALQAKAAGPEAQLIAWTRERLAHFKCPAGVSFTGSLARTASGKLQKQAIRASLSSAALP